MTNAFPDDPEPDPPDWKLLAGLFEAGSSFRHRMGLRRLDARNFYVVTPARDAIREEKRHLLNAKPGLYSLCSPYGEEAAVEFAETLALDVPSDVMNIALSLAIEPDLLFVSPPHWTLEWANVCFPTRWSLEGKLHEPLGSIHAIVPALNVELGRKITTFFDRLEPGDGWQRANWGLSASTQRNQHPTRSFAKLTDQTPPEQVYVRVENQHFLKLPKTGAIAFGIRIATFRLSDLAEQPSVRAGLAEQLRTMPGTVRNYKGITAFAGS